MQCGQYRWALVPIWDELPRGATWATHAYVYRHNKSVIRIRQLQAVPLPLDKRFLQEIRIQDNFYYHWRITREVWDVMVLYYQITERDGIPFAGTTLNQFIRKMVPKNKLQLGKNVRYKRTNC